MDRRNKIYNRSALERLWYLILKFAWSLVAVMVPSADDMSTLHVVISIYLWEALNFAVKINLELALFLGLWKSTSTSMDSEIMPMGRLSWGNLIVVVKMSLDHVDTTVLHQSSSDTSLHIQLESCLVPHPMKIYRYEELRTRTSSKTIHVWSHHIPLFWM